MPGSVGIRACGTTNPTISGNTFDGSAAAVVFRSCSGENGTTAANQVTGENVAALRSNLEGQDLGNAAVGVPGPGTVAFGDSPTPPAGVPSQPLVESVVAGDRQVTARWTPALAAEGAPITAYRIRVRTTAGAEPVQTIDAPADAIESVITGLANGTTHYVTVAAVNSAGESPTGDWSTSAVTPQGPPSAPLEATLESPAPGAISMSWKPPANDGGKPLTGYRAHIYADPAGSEPLPGSPVDLAPDTNAHAWSGLTEARTYYLQVTASNELGEGSASDLIAVVVRPTPAAVPPNL